MAALHERYLSYPPRLDEKNVRQGMVETTKPRARKVRRKESLGKLFGDRIGWITGLLLNQNLFRALLWNARWVRARKNVLWETVSHVIHPWFKKIAVNAETNPSYTHHGNVLCIQNKTEQRPSVLKLPFYKIPWLLFLAPAIEFSCSHL